VSLNKREIAATRAELREALRRCGLSIDQLAAALDISSARVRSAVELAEPVNSVDVWAVRDVLEHAIRRAQAAPVEFSSLTEGVRPRARTWFPLREVDESVLDSIPVDRIAPNASDLPELLGGVTHF
jgi:hypothetical protein